MKKRKKLLERLILELDNMKPYRCGDAFENGYDSALNAAIRLLEDEIKKLEAVE